MTSSVAVVHLVRAGNDPAALQRFVRSYRAHPAGLDHDLVVVFKGFESAAAQSAAARPLADLRYSALVLGDDGFDITAYRRSIERLPHDSFCFLNSYSEILAADWLHELHAPAARGDTGIAGCTGSYQSNFHVRVWQYERAVDRLLDTRRQRKASGAMPWSGWNDAIRAMPDRRRWRFFAGYPALIAWAWAVWPPFPNYHVRTNAFVVRREIAEAIRWPTIRTKMDTYRFESGPRSLTRQILALGKRAVVVGRDGSAYDKEDWHRSRTFWSGHQENLLVADNQTRDYDEGDAARRAFLSAHAWGPLAATAEAHA